MRTLTLFTFVIFLFASCSKDPEVIPSNEVDFLAFGLDGLTVNQIETFETTLIAATSDGVYRKNLLVASSQWEKMGAGLNGKDIRAMIVFDLNTIIASSVNIDDDAQSTIYKTNNAGNTWVEFQGGFGNGTKEAVYAFAKDPTDNDILYASGKGVIAKSTDRGLTWEKVYGEWGSIGNGITSLSIKPGNTSVVLGGGQNAIEQGIFLRSTSGGAVDSWTIELDVVPAPSTVKRMVYRSSNGTLYTGWEGALLSSTNDGETWNTLIEAEDNRFFFGVIPDPSDNNIIWAAGWVKEYDQPQPLILFRSTDGGATWKSFEAKNDLELFGGVYSMAYKEDAFTKKLYFGLYKGGVYVASIQK